MNFLLQTESLKITLKEASVFISKVLRIISFRLLAKNFLTCELHIYYEKITTCKLYYLEPLTNIYTNLSWEEREHDKMCIKSRSKSKSLCNISWREGKKYNFLLTHNMLLCSYKCIKISPLKSLKSFCCFFWVIYPYDDDDHDDLTNAFLSRKTTKLKFSRKRH
jgi:hypothetical protein